MAALVAPFRCSRPVISFNSRPSGLWTLDTLDTLDAPDALMLFCPVRHGYGPDDRSSSSTGRRW